MAVYATSADLAEYLSDNPSVEMPSDAPALDRLLLRAERVVDLACGPWPRYADGRKFSPPLLDVTQRQALARATCAAAEFEMLLGVEHLAGEPDFIPSGLQVVSRAASEAPRMFAELAGHGLVKRSLTVGTPVPVVPAVNSL